MNDIARDVQELETLFPSAKRVTIPGRDEPVEIMPFNVLQLAKTASVIRKILAEDNDSLDVVDLLLKYPYEIIQLMSIALDVPEVAIHRLPADVALKLAVAVVEVNAPFFVNEAGKIVAALASKLGVLGSGQDNSNGSGTTTTPTQSATQ